MYIAEINKLTNILRSAYSALQDKDLNTVELRKEISDNIYTLSVFKHQDKPSLAIPTDAENTHFSNTKEFHDMMREFEKTYKHRRLDREKKEIYHLQAFYQDGGTNELFIAFMHGYQFRKIY